MSDEADMEERAARRREREQERLRKEAEMEAELERSRAEREERRRQREEERKKREATEAAELERRKAERERRAEEAKQRAEEEQAAAEEKREEEAPMGEKEEAPQEKEEEEEAPKEEQAPPAVDDAAVARLEREVADLRAQLEAAKALEREVADLREQLATASTEQQPDDRERKRADAAEQERDQLRKELAAAKGEIDSLNRALSTSTKIEERLEKAVTDARRRAADAEAEVAELTDEVATLKKAKAKSPRTSIRITSPRASSKAMSPRSHSRRGESPTSVVSPRKSGQRRRAGTGEHVRSPRGNNPRSPRGVVSPRGRRGTSNVVAVEGPSCHKCNKSLAGQVSLSFGAHKFHSECFSCMTCGAALSGSGRVMKVKDLPYCQKCGKGAFLNRGKGAAPAAAAAKKKPSVLDRFPQAGGGGSAPVASASSGTGFKDELALLRERAAAERNKQLGITGADAEAFTAADEAMLLAYLNERLTGVSGARDRLDALDDGSKGGLVSGAGSGAPFNDGLADGVLLAQLVGDINPRELDVRVINTSPAGKKEKRENHQLAVNAARALGCRLTGVDYGSMVDGDRSTVLRVLFEVCKADLKNRVRRNQSLLQELADGGACGVDKGDARKLATKKLEELVAGWLAAESKHFKAGGDVSPDTVTSAVWADVVPDASKKGLLAAVDTVLGGDGKVHKSLGVRNLEATSARVLLAALARVMAVS